MPHVILEYAAPVARKTDLKQLLADIHAAVRASGLFEPGAIKSRCVAYDRYQVGDAAEGADFAHTSLWILDGRPVAVRQALGRSVLAVMRAALPDVTSLTVDVREMERATYMKHRGR